MRCADCTVALMDDEIYVCESCDRRHQQHADEVCGTEFEVIDAVRREGEANV